KGWKIGQDVFLLDLYKALAPPAEWGYISEIKIAAGAPQYTSPSTAVPTHGATGSPASASGNAGAASDPTSGPRPPITDKPGRVHLFDFELVCKGQIDADQISVI